MFEYKKIAIYTAAVATVTAGAYVVYTLFTRDSDITDNDTSDSGTSDAQE